MPKRKHFHNAAQKNNFTPTESIVNEDYSDELAENQPKKGKQVKRRK